MQVLRNFQQRATDALVYHIQKNHKTLLVSPCGSGKTVMIAELARWCVENNLRILIVAHRREIVRQIDACLTRQMKLPEDNVNVILADHEKDGATPDALVHVASKDTIMRRTLPRVDVLVIDECHRAMAPVYQKLARYYSDIPQVGFTATPFRLDGKGLGDYFDVLVEAAKPSELIQQGFLAEPRVFTTSHAFLPDLEGVQKLGGDYVVSQLSARVLQDHLIGDIVRHRNERAWGKITVVFCVDIAHSKAVRDRFIASGVAAEHVDGSMDTEEREAILARVSRGETQVLCNCMVLSEGWDLPACQVVVLARPTHSLSLYIQQSGRGMRVFGNERPFIFDHSGNVPKFFLPHADRQYVLSSSKVMGTLGAPPVKTCSSCMAIVPAGCKACPECGAEFPYEPRLSGPLPETTDTLLEIRMEELRARAVGYALGKNIVDPEGWADKIMDKYKKLQVEV